ncbi:glycosyltransferase family 9 protein [Pseudodesulfovibrio sediminis]|uniref:ADP-heptose:LPS heptosyltransferase n=1 Tax=Pseudodesulfovibrio sediminis TaxID=2810563 RepID=A0ABM7P6M8_9BACT|nr:glycosyltransferase family 9 protein [Pseudodesulfovibrio sediminis]BCS89179.1 hypothetical protein PSDVSF_24210 [Pseudodesulfovibrio sediminis]
MQARTGTLLFPEKGLGKHKKAALLASNALYAMVICHEDDQEYFAGSNRAVRTYAGGNIAPCRNDLDKIATLLLPPEHTPLHVVSESPQIAPFILTALRLLGHTEVVRVWTDDATPQTIPPLPRTPIQSLVIKATGGIGNIVLNTCLVSAALRHGWETWFCPTSDLNAPLDSLFLGHGRDGLHVVNQTELAHMSADICLNIEDHNNREKTDFFHGPYRVGTPGHEPGFAAQFFTNILGVDVDLGDTFIGGAPTELPQSWRDRIVICPGSKVGWDSKRWPHMDALIRRLDNPVVLCRQEDLDAYATLDFLTPITAGNAEYLTTLSLNEAACLLKSARGVIANDCGPAHMAAAAGVPTLMLFGPSSMEKNEHKRTNVRSLNLDLDCQPCQGKDDGPGRLGPGNYGCELNYRCMTELDVGRVLTELGRSVPGL